MPSLPNRVVILSTPYMGTKIKVLRCDVSCKASAPSALLQWRQVSHLPEGWVGSGADREKEDCSQYAISTQLRYKINSTSFIALSIIILKYCKTNGFLLWHWNREHEFWVFWWTVQYPYSCLVKSAEYMVPVSLPVLVYESEHPKAAGTGDLAKRKDQVKFQYFTEILKTWC